MNARSTTQTDRLASGQLLWLDTEEERRLRHLAWVCSVCALFLAMGMLSLTHHHTFAKQSLPARSKQIVPVVFTPPAASSSTEARTQPAVAMPAKQPSVAAPRRPVAEIMLPGAGVSPVPSTELLSPLPASPTTATVPVNEPADSPSRFQPEAGAPNTPQPVYPPLALRRGYEGTVVVGFTVAPSGEIIEVRLRQSSGYAVLDEAVLETVRRRWKFPPGPTRHHYFETVFQLQ